MEATLAVGAQQTFRMSKELHARFQRFHEQHPFIPVNRILERALTYYLDAAEKGVDSRLEPTKTRRV